MFVSINYPYSMNYNSIIYIGFPCMSEEKITKKKNKTKLLGQLMSEEKIVQKSWC